MEDLGAEIPETPQRPFSSQEADPPCPSSVPLLETIDDWGCWAECMRLVLRALDAEGLTEKKPLTDSTGRILNYETKREDCIQAFLRSRCGKPALEFINDARTVYEMWAVLSSQCGTTRFEAESRAFSTLTQVKFRHYVNTKHYVIIFRKFLGHLETAGLKLDDKIGLYLFMTGLENKDARWVTTNVEGIGPWREAPDFENVVEQLLRRERANEDDEDDSIILGD